MQQSKVQQKCQHILWDIPHKISYGKVTNQPWVCCNNLHIATWIAIAMCMAYIYDVEEHYDHYNKLVCIVWYITLYSPLDLFQ